MNEPRYRCKLCGRDKFPRPMPHRCRVGFLKRINKAARLRGMESIFEVVKDNNEQVERMTREEYYNAIPHYCQYPQPDTCNIVMGCWGILHGKVQERVDYCRICELKVMAKRKVRHNRRQLMLLPDLLDVHDAW